MTIEAMKSAAAQFKSRANFQKVKPGTKRYNEMQSDFFTGVMAGWIALLGDDPIHHPDYPKTVPPIWVIGLMVGDDLVEKAENYNNDKN